jgi:predicted nucleic acid-binding protein
MQSDSDGKSIKGLARNSKKITLVVDANIIFAALIREGITSSLLNHNSLDLLVPGFLYNELLKHKQVILDKTKRSDKDLFFLLDNLEKIAVTVPETYFQEFLEEAEQTSPDPDDVIYFALALKLNCPIWSNDKRLKAQDKVKILSTEELADLLK